MKFGKINKQGAFNYDGWDLVYDSDDESISFPVTEIDTGAILDGNTDEVYKISYIVVQNGASAQSLFVRPNNLTTSIYGFQYLNGSSTTMSAFRNTSTTGFDGGFTRDAGDVCIASWDFYAKSGNERILVGGYGREIDGTTVSNTRALGQVLNDTSTNITSIRLVGVSSGIGSGSRLVVHRKVLV